MTWTITQDVTTVTLPYNPSAYGENNPVQIDQIGIDGVGSILISRFKKARGFTLEGVVTAADNATAESTYLAPLRAMVGQIITVSAPDSQFTGNWLMENVFFRREGGSVSVRYSYTISLLLGSSNVVY